jgi:hypothetical protein
MHTYIYIGARAGRVGCNEQEGEGRGGGKRVEKGSEGECHALGGGGGGFIEAISKGSLEPKPLKESHFVKLLERKQMIPHLMYVAPS